MSRFGEAAIFWTALSVSTGVLADECQSGDVQEVSIEVDTSKVIRADAPKELFGFNLPWRDFQLGYFRAGTVRPELLEWLAPFKGASYRYPGGTPSNWFEWRKSVGPIAQRTVVHADFERYAVPAFGLAEFADFVTAVKGRALLTLNLVGPYKNVQSPEVVATDTLEMLSYVKSQTSFGCVGGAGCSVMAWELGNELDWAPFLWPATAYLKRAGAVVSAVSPVMPEVTWVANGKTSPWDARSANYASYNQTLASGMADKVQGIAVHPYYDGISVPSAAKYVADYGKTWAAARAGAKVFVTEHARWPAQPANARWESNWYQATGLGGAISSVDFLLGILGNAQVASANWHALGVEGPWQLIRWNKTNDFLYPSPVYWGLRTVREAYLEHVVQTRYSQPAGASYTGGYDLRLVGMSSASAQSASVIGINRNAKPYKLRIVWTAGGRKAGGAVLRSISGLSESEDNTDAAPQRVIMKTSSKTLSMRSSSLWCVPGYAVFSIVEP